MVLVILDRTAQLSSGLRTADGASHEDGRPHKTAVLGRTGRMSRSRGRQDMPSEFCQQLGAFLFHQLCASVTSA